VRGGVRWRINGIRFWRVACVVGAGDGFASDLLRMHALDFSLLLHPIHAPLVPNRSAFARSVRSANTDENHPNAEPLQDGFHMLRFEFQHVRHRTHDPIVVVR
jgi:hypothetical protein